MAPVEVRVHRVMVETRLDQKAATAKVRAYDREMAGRLDYLFGVDWTRPEHYDLVLNTSDDTWAFYTDFLVAAARHPQYQPTPESVQRVKDLRLAAQVRVALAADPGTQAVHVEVTAQTGHVVLKGVVFNRTVLDAAAAVAQRVPGVASVACEVEEIPPYAGQIM